MRPRSTSTTGASCNPRSGAGRNAGPGTVLRTAPTWAARSPRSPAGARSSRAPPSAPGPASRLPDGRSAPAARQHALQSGPTSGCPPGGAHRRSPRPRLPAHRLPRPGAKAGTAGRASAAPCRPLPSSGPGPEAPESWRPGPARPASPRPGPHTAPRPRETSRPPPASSPRAVPASPAHFRPADRLFRCVPRRGKSRRWRAADSMVPPPPAPSPPAPFGESRLQRTFNSMVLLHLS